MNKEAGLYDILSAAGILSQLPSRMKGGELYTTTLANHPVLKRVRDPFQFDAEVEALIKLTTAWSSQSLPPFAPLLCFDPLDRSLVLRHVDGIHLKHFYYSEGVKLENQVPVALRLIAAVEFINSQGVAHLDLHGENILVSTTGNVFLTDFGLSAIGEDINIVRQKKTRSKKYRYWKPPETVTEMEFNGALADRYSLASQLICLFFNPVFFELNQSMTLGDQISLLQKLNPNIPDEVTNLLITNMRKDPEERTNLLDKLKDTIQILIKN